jgi:uncharacterized membrane protein
MFDKPFFNREQRTKIVTAIKEAELNTSGEIRVHVSSKCDSNVLDSASYWFEKLKMHKTELRNGVLFFLATKDQKFAILGDVGINNKVPDNFWDNIKEEVLSNFKNGNFDEGLRKGILMAGEQLKSHFPHQKDDVNELNDEISFG